MEYSGITKSGDRRMGIVPCQGLATHVQDYHHLSWKVILCLDVLCLLC